jgi:predicted lipoprotein with Yx(FWY)xxD motif
MQVETVSGSEVLAASMDNDFSLLPHGNFPVYTLSKKDDDSSGERDDDENACGGLCALIWPPVLTSGRPEAGPGVDQHDLGVILRPDGTHQVTYNGKPLFLFIKDAYIPGIIGTQSINGAGAVTRWGVFNTIPLS